MCGIAGFIATSVRLESPEEILRRMIDAIAHRGPDDSGIWLDTGAGVALGHRRLSILDLSPHGAQPMVSHTGRFVIVYNGEIYNYVEIRKELDGLALRPWRGHSDTEVMLAAFEEWGIDGALRRFVGMFAFALWDRRERCLAIARDRLGEKPLYYGTFNGTFLFASELKALREHPSFPHNVDRDAIALLLQYNYIPAPHSIYEGIRKLPPGTYLNLRADGSADSPIPYWSVNAVTQEGQARPFLGSSREAVDQLETLLRHAVRQQMAADVPLGAFLSGGIDSSAIVALMQTQSTQPVRTFSIGFHEAAYNEAQHAKAVARHLGTDHTELYVTPREAIDVIPRLPQLYDEPFSDSSQVPTFLVSQMTRRHVTVSLSGDAGDELFAGYTRYVMTENVWGMLSRIPVGIRRAIAATILSVPPKHLTSLAELLGPTLPKVARTTLAGEKLHKGARAMTSRSAGELYRRVVSQWSDPLTLVLGARDAVTVLSDASLQPSVTGDIERMAALDMLTYLPDDILTKVDRAAMGVSLETRVPFLDHRVVEFACTLPLHLKVHDGVGKWVLRQVLKKYVPETLTDRPKQGFGIPIDSWLRGPLRAWAEDLFGENRLRSEGYLNPGPIRQKWDEHLSGKRNWHYHLWTVLMFQAWKAEERKRPLG